MLRCFTAVLQHCQVLRFAGSTAQPINTDVLSLPNQCRMARRGGCDIECSHRPSYIRSWLRDRDYYNLVEIRKSAPLRLRWLISMASSIQNINHTMRFWSFLPIVLAIHNAVDATASSGTSPAILTPDFVRTVQQIVDADGIPGLTLAIIYQNASLELGAWGFKDENGTNMTTDVRCILQGSRHTDEITTCAVDTVQYRFLFEGLPLCFSWDPDRRFRAWAEHYTLACGLINTELEDKSG